MNPSHSDPVSGLPESSVPAGSSESSSQALSTRGTDSVGVGRPLNTPVSTGGFSSWLHALRRRWLLALSLSLLCGGAATWVAWRNWQPDYAPTATLRIASHQPSLLDAKGNEAEQATFDVYKKTQQQLLRDRFVLNAALRDPTVAQLPIVKQQLDPVEWLQKEIVITFPGDAEILQISIHSQNPATAAAVVNAVCDAYVDRIVHAERDERLNRLQSLEKLYNDAEEKVRQKRSELKELTESLGTGDSKAATLKQQIALEEYASMRKERLTVQLGLMRANAKQVVTEAHLEALEKQPIARELLDARITAHPDYIAAVQAVEALRQKSRNVELVVADNQQSLIDKYRRSVAAEEEKLGQLRVRLEPGVEADLRQELIQQTKADLEATISEVSTLRAEDERLSQDVTKLAGEANQIGRSSVDLEMMRTELDNLETVRKQLDSEVESLKIELASAARVEVLSRAIASQSNDNKGQIRLAGACGAAGFLLPLLSICWWDTRRKKVNTPQEVSVSLGLPIVGTVPLIPARVHRRLAANGPPTVWTRLLTESVDAIRETLMNQRRSRPLKVVVISSAISGEGKTTIATQLAKSFGRAGSRTLLVDFDLRCPATHLVFGNDSGPGLVELLDGTQQLAQVIFPTGEAHLYHLPVGGIRSGSNELLSSKRKAVEAVFGELRSQFDIIIVDSCPILPAVDTLVIGQFADAAILAVMRDVSQSYQIMEARARLEQVGVHVLGGVVSCRPAYVYGLTDRYRQLFNGNAEPIEMGTTGE
ncbi:MAG TPA: AAA family ATPase [Pirellulales bacterium]|nr:AAA family ATPase [Pirellulales bacterium]